MLIVVVGGGFEPPKALPADLQSAPFDHSGTPPCSLAMAYSACLTIPNSVAVLNS